MRQGAPRMEALAHRERVVELFCAGDTNCLSKKTALFLLPMSDWRQSKIVIFVGSSSLVSRKEATQLIVNGFLFVLCGSKFSVLNKSRWHGKEICLDRFALLDLVHNLGEDTYAEFCRL